MVAILEKSLISEVSAVNWTIEQNNRILMLEVSYIQNKIYA